MTMADDAAARIRGWLHDGTIGRDRFHSVPQMAERLGMSRSPVREGLLRLAEAGLVEFVPQRGFRPVRPTGQDIAEIFALRIALEPAAAARAANAGSAAVAAELRRHLAEMRAAARADAAGFDAADEQLHAAILDRAGNGRLTGLIAGLRDTTRLIGASTAGRSRSRHEILAEHEPIVDAISAGDQERAAAEMRRHLLSTGRLLVAQAHDDGDENAWSCWESLVESTAEARRV
ncbi:GntR family transcriptional regulator [Flexivirga alba]|uniref:GntR family transcriptional regulator n=1 Tax=Flexivirga alba TaxID=702742 RepID=A0ABW2AEB5_9MICO